MEDDNETVTNSNAVRKNKKISESQTQKSTEEPKPKVKVRAVIFKEAVTVDGEMVYSARTGVKKIKSLEFFGPHSLLINSSKGVPLSNVKEFDLE